MRKNFNTFIMSHMILVNFILSILLLIIFLIMVFIVRYPIEDGMSENITITYKHWINYDIHDYRLDGWLFFIIYSLGLFINTLSPLLLIILILLKKRIQKLFLLLPFIGIFPFTLYFVYALVNHFLPFFIIYPTLLILITVQLIVNLKYDKYKDNLNEKNI